MANYFGKFNKQRLFNHELPENAEYFKIEELLQKGIKEVVVRGFYINTKSYFGDSAVLMTDDYYINLPQHFVETVKGIEQDPQAVAMINQGNVKAEFYSYETKKYGTCYSLNLVG